MNAISLPITTSLSPAEAARAAGRAVRRGGTLQVAEAAAAKSADVLRALDTERKRLDPAAPGFDRAVAALAARRAEAEATHRSHKEQCRALRPGYVQAHRRALQPHAIMAADRVAALAAELAEALAVYDGVISECERVAPVELHWRAPPIPTAALTGLGSVWRSL